MKLPLEPTMLTNSFPGVLLLLWGAAPAPPTLAPVTLASPTSASLTTEPLQFWLRPYAPPPTVRILHFWTRFPRPSHYAALPYGRYGPAYRSSGPGSCSLPRASLKRKCCRQVASGWSWTLASWTVLTNPRQFLTRPGSGLRWRGSRKLGVGLAQGRHVVAGEGGRPGVWSRYDRLSWGRGTCPVPEAFVFVCLSPAWVGGRAGWVGRRVGPGPVVARGFCAFRGSGGLGTQEE